jgi:hypothetical protein
MASHESLDNLIEGLAGAVVEAQRRIEAHQISNFISYFDKDKRPRKLDILVPSNHPDATLGEDDVRYRVPLLPLVASSLLRIKEVEISFDTELIGITDSAPAEPLTDKLSVEPGSEELAEKKQRSINLDLRGSGVFKKSQGTAHVVIKVEGKEISEGMTRLIDRLLQVQGDID